MKQRMAFRMLEQLGYRAEKGIITVQQADNEELYESLLSLGLKRSANHSIRVCKTPEAAIDGLLAANGLTSLGEAAYDGGKFPFLAALQSQDTDSLNDHEWKAAARTASIKRQIERGYAIKRPDAHAVYNDNFLACEEGDQEYVNAFFSACEPQPGEHSADVEVGKINRPAAAPGGSGTTTTRGTTTSSDTAGTGSGSSCRVKARASSARSASKGSGGSSNLASARGAETDDGRTELHSKEQGSSSTRVSARGGRPVSARTEQGKAAGSSKTGARARSKTGDATSAAGAGGGSASTNKRRNSQGSVVSGPRDPAPFFSDAHHNLGAFGRPPPLPPTSGGGSAPAPSTFSAGTCGDAIPNQATGAAAGPLQSPSTRYRRRLQKLAVEYPKVEAKFVPGGEEAVASINNTFFRGKPPREKLDPDVLAARKAVKAMFDRLSQPRVAKEKEESTAKETTARQTKDAQMRACERLMKQTKSKPDAGDAGDKGSKQLVAENKAKADSTAAESGPANANPHGVGAAYRTSMLGTKSKQGQGPAAANPPNKQQVLLRGSKARATKQKPSARFEWLFSKVSIETKILVNFTNLRPDATRALIEECLWTAIMIAGQNAAEKGQIASEILGKVPNLGQLCLWLWQEGQMLSSWALGKVESEMPLLFYAIFPLDDVGGEPSGSTASVGPNPAAAVRKQGSTDDIVLASAVSASASTAAAPAAAAASTTTPSSSSTSTGGPSLSSSMKRVYPFPSGARPQAVQEAEALKASCRRMVENMRKTQDLRRLITFEELKALRDGLLQRALASGAEHEDEQEVGVEGEEPTTVQQNEQMVRKPTSTAQKDRGTSRKNGYFSPANSTASSSSSTREAPTLEEGPTLEETMDENTMEEGGGAEEAAPLVPRLRTASATQENDRGEATLKITQSSDAPPGQGVMERSPTSDVEMGIEDVNGRVVGGDKRHEERETKANASSSCSRPASSSSHKSEEFCGSPSFLDHALVNLHEIPRTSKKNLSRKPSREQGECESQQTQNAEQSTKESAVDSVRKQKRIVEEVLGEVGGKNVGSVGIAGPSAPKKSLRVGKSKLSFWTPDSFR